jgi:hypothetical protein
MEYKASLIPLTKISNASCFEKGTLCDQCSSYDCSNPIVSITVSIVGVNKKMKIWKTSTNRFAVMQCEGFMKDSISIDEDEDA